MLKRLYLFLFAFALISCGTNVKTNLTINNAPKQEILEEYTLHLNPEGVVPFSGYVNFDDFTNTPNGQGVVYSGYNGATFLASILAHSAISKSIDKARLSAFESSSEVALAGYSEFLADFKLNNLLDEFWRQNTADHYKSMKLIREISQFQSPKGMVTSSPSFILTKKNDALIIENVIKRHEVQTKSSKSKRKKRSVRTERSKSKYSYENVVVIISDEIIDPKNYLSENFGENLKRMSADLFLESINFATQDMNPLSASIKFPQETIRFYIGDILRIERGNVLHRECGRIIFKTLRGWIKSVPQNEVCQA
jgi:hypothetical protein